VDFGLTEEHLLIRETVRQFMAGECPREMARAPSPSTASSSVQIPN
jgi:hypothetical protein